MGKIKALTGGDLVTCNPKNKEPYSFVSGASIIVSTNNLPDSGGCKAMKDRCFYIEYLSDFNSEAPETVEEQESDHHYPEDINIQKKLCSRRQAFMWFLLDRLKNIDLSQRYIPSEECQRVNKKMAESTNKFKQFFDNRNFKKCEEGVIVCIALYEEYRKTTKWPVDEIIFRQEMTKLFDVKVDGGTWRGWS